jgi:pimeloyl-ACP methyl ester carboxylesterase
MQRSQEQAYQWAPSAGGITPESSAVHTNALNLRRRGEGAPLLLIHGVAGSGIIFDQVLDHLGPGFEALRVDLLGYGYSPKPAVTYSPTTHVDAIRRTVVDAGVSEPAFVMGLSMGSALALEYAARFPESTRAVVALGLPYYRDEEEARRELQHNLWTALVIRVPSLARVLIPALWGAGRRSRVLSRMLAPRMYSAEVARESMMPTYHAFSSTVVECLVRNRIEPLFDATAEIPMTFVHGGEDKWCPPQRVEALVAGRDNCTFHRLADVGHNVAVIAPAAVARLASDFLSSPR